MNRRSFLRLTAAAPAALAAGALAARVVDSSVKTSEPREPYRIRGGTVYVATPAEPDRWLEIGQFSDPTITHG